MQTANDIRRHFLEYFAKNGHEIVESGPLVPRNDPTLMFTNAGMVQFKNVFVGAENRPYSRAVTSQKCVRAGGKHNDLENVGYTARHHTFFEMLGNFSFGDYFKDVAIELAWNLVTREFGLPKDRLMVTVYADDDQAFDLWRKIAGLPEHKIVRIGTSDNFWAMGDTGPCGPCSEIFYDHGDHIPGGPPGSPDEDGDRFIEIWNLVFMQYEQVTKEQRVDLPKPSIDTGMGLERIAAVMKGTHDNYEVDLLRNLIESSAAATGTDPDGANKVSHRVIADHLRATSFLIADGVLPSNEGRGYVLRRIMRRAMRHAHLIGCTEPLLYRLVATLDAGMGAAFPELTRARALIEETLKLEEIRFKRTLDRGLKLLEEETADIPAGGSLDGDVAFKLYDTYGFPLDLTQDALRGRGLGVDVDGFEAAMDRQRADARKAWAGSGEAATETVWFDLREKLGATDFLGYSVEAAEGKIIALVADGQPVDEAAAGTRLALITNQTPFYGESGGQVGDVGQIITENARLTVTDTQKKLGDLHVHLAMVEEGTVTVGEDARLLVDGDRRAATRANHSATHLMHEALRRALGDHVTQKGSLVAPERLRFDFSHPKAMNREELDGIEAQVNGQIRLNEPVVTRLMTPDEAINQGAMALFGEKYGDEVRVVSMGRNGEESYSLELCGGTHVRRTGDIGLFHVVSESAVAAGVRRIEALTGEAARQHLAEQDTRLREAAELLRTSPAELSGRIRQLMEDRKRLERDLTETRKKMAEGGGPAASEAKTVAGVGFADRVLDGVPAKELKGMVDEMKKRMGSGVAVVIADNEGKASIVVGVTEDLTERFSAVDLVRVGAAALGGKGGGGRPDMAQAGGPDASKAAEAIAAIQQAMG